MCPPEPALRDGNGSDKTENAGYRGHGPPWALRPQTRITSATAAQRRLLARRCGPYGGVRDVSIFDRRVAGDGDPYGG